MYITRNLRNVRENAKWPDGERGALSSHNLLPIEIWIGFANKNPCNPRIRKRNRTAYSTIVPYTQARTLACTDSAVYPIKGGAKGRLRLHAVILSRFTRRRFFFAEVRSRNGGILLKRIPGGNYYILYHAG